MLDEVFSFNKYNGSSNSNNGLKFNRGSGAYFRQSVWLNMMPYKYNNESHFMWTI